MTPLAEILVRRIAASGPMSIADYMTECLLHPQHGYYATREPFGAQGDFTTAPEISQMFGEVLGLCLAQAWIDQGKPARFTLAEPGPGRGTLMADILRATQNVPGFVEAADVHLIEASERLRTVQRETLKDHEISWSNTISQVPDAPLFLIANEFFDALPVRQFTRDTGGWREHQIGLLDGALTLGLSAPAPIGDLDHRLIDTKTGDIVELCAPAKSNIRSISSHVARFGGAAIVIDYGNWRSLGDTLQAVRNHQRDGILANPGLADLTAHVDFEALANAAHEVAISAMVPQGVLLQRLGITARAQSLAGKLGGNDLENHIAAHRRLTHPDEMGTLFKAMAIYNSTHPEPPGFAPGFTQ